MKISNAKDVYDHYSVSYPCIEPDRELSKKALNDIASKHANLSFYAKELLRFLEYKKIGINEFIFLNLFEEMLKYTGVGRHHGNYCLFRRICELLCYKYEITKLALELCIVPDIYKSCSYFNINALEKGLSEAYLGIYPFSLLSSKHKKAILLNISMPLNIINIVKEFLAYCRTRDPRRNTDTTTLIMLWCHIRRMICGTKTTSWSDLNGHEGARKLIEHFEKKRFKRKNGRVIEYQYQFDTCGLDEVRMLFYVMSEKMGIPQSPFTVIDPTDPSPAANKRKLMKTVRLPDSSGCYGRTKDGDQVRIKLPSGEVISPCFTMSEVVMICSYIKDRCNSILNNEEPDLSTLSIKQIYKYYQIIQGDLILAFSILNGARPIDYLAINLEQIGEYSLDISDPINDRFYNSIVPIRDNVKKSKNKLRPEKKIFGNIFTILIQALKTFGVYLKAVDKEIVKGCFSNMIEEGTPIFRSSSCERATPDTLLKHFRMGLVRAGIDVNKVKVATLYWCRKAFITFAHNWGLGIEHVSKLTGTNPTTLYKYYVQLDLLCDTDEKYANCFLGKLGMKPIHFKPSESIYKAPSESVIPDIGLMRKAPANNLIVINDNDSCDLNTALSKLDMTKNKIIDAFNKGYIKGNKENKKYYFSIRSLLEFQDKYIPVEKVAEILSKNKRKKMSIRRATQIMVTDLKDFTISITNKFYTEYIEVLKLNQDRKGFNKAA